MPEIYLSNAILFDQLKSAFSVATDDADSDSVVHLMLQQ